MSFLLSDLLHSEKKLTLVEDQGKILVMNEQGEVIKIVEDQILIKLVQEIHIPQVNVNIPETFEFKNSYEERDPFVHPLDLALELEEREEKPETDLVNKTPDQSLEVVLVEGQGISQVYYFPLIMNSLSLADLNPSLDQTIVLTKSENSFFMNVGGAGQFFDLQTKTPISQGRAISQSDSILYDAGVIKLYIRYSKKPPSLKLSPILMLEREFKRTLIPVLASFILFFITSFWMIPEQKVEEERVVAVIYKAPELPKPEPVKVEKVSGGSEGKAGQKSNSAIAKTTNMFKNLNRMITSSTSMSEIAASNLAPTKSNENKIGAMANLGHAPASIGGTVDGTGLGTGKGSKDFGEGLKGTGAKKGIMVGEVSTKTIVMGSIDPDLLRKILQEYLPQFRHCYQREIEKASDKFKGIVDLEFTIGKNGSVTKTDIKAREGGFTNQGINCLSSILRVIKFPEPKGGGMVDVRQPLNFYPEDSKS